MAPQKVISQNWKRRSPSVGIPIYHTNRQSLQRKHIFCPPPRSGAKSSLTCWKIYTVIEYVQNYIIAKGTFGSYDLKFSRLKLRTKSL
jgi:hypothetical protein